MHEISLREAREASGLSLREAAKLLKISHPYLSALELGHKPLRAENELKIRRLYKIPDGSIITDVLPEDKNQFSEWLGSQVKWWDSRFVLPMVPAVTSLISDIYVEPFFQVPEAAAVSSSELLQRFLSDSENRALLLSGGMGSGKSFFLRILTIEAERIQKELGLKKRFVPILVSLGDFSLSSGSLVHSLVEYYRGLGFDGSPKKLEQFFKQCIDRGNALLLFDGLDEVKNLYQRSEMLALLQQHFENSLRRGGSKMIVSGQGDALADRDPRYAGFQLVSIEPWRSSQLFDGCRRWRWNDQEEADRFWLVLQSNDRLHKLARWPLLFHLFTTLHSAYGLRAFEEMASLFDACCQVLENSWEGARRSLSGKSRSQGMLDSSEGFSWLRWRHFFIFLMERSLARLDPSDENVPFSFSPGEMQECWEEFLSTRGLERRTVAYAKLEDVVKEQNRIGPIMLGRQRQKERSVQGVNDRYTFLDDSFGEYYAAKALINNPEMLPEHIRRHLRSPGWENIIPLAIQELCRSERTYERDLGEQLLGVVQQLDDDLGLDHKHRVGRFGLFTAVRSVGSVNLDRHWDSLVKEFLDSYLFAEKDPRTFDTEFWRMLEILGEFSASPRVSNYLRGVYENLFGTSKKSGFAHQTKWRLLGAMAKVGAQSDFVVEALIADIEQFMHEHDSLSSEERVNIRRLLWSIRACGRVYRKEELGVSSAARQAAIPRIQLTLKNTFERVCRSFEDQMMHGEFSKFHYWHILVVVTRAQHGLDYREDLSASLMRMFSLIDRNVDVILSDYPNRMQLLQFLKAMSCHAWRIPKALLHSTLAKLGRNVEALPATERRELELIIELAKASSQNEGTPRIEQALLESVYGAPLEELAVHWRDVLLRQQTAPNPDSVSVGAAATGLEYVARNSPQTLHVFDPREIANIVLDALNTELQIQDFQQREEERFYTRIGAPYGLPIYDHLYNCILSLSRRLPLSAIAYKT